MKKVLHKLLNWAIVVCIAISLFMRCRLFNMAYEYDELFTAISTDPTLPFWWIYSHYLLPDVHPPLYNMLIWSWNHLVPFGPEVWLRVPSWIMGMAALLYAWFLFPKYLGKTVRFVFVALISCNMYVMFYCQHARSYMFVLLLAVAYTFLFLDFCRRIPQKQQISLRQWVTFAALSVLLCWSHYFGALLANLCCGYILLRAVQTKKYIKHIFITWAVVWVTFLPWMVPNLLAQTTFNRMGGNWAGDTLSLADIPRVLTYFLFTNRICSLIMGALLLLGLFLIGRTYKQTGHVQQIKVFVPLLCIMLGAFFVVILISLKTYMFYERYFIAFLPVIYLLVALVITSAVRRGLLGQILLVTFLGYTLLCFEYEYKDWKYTPRTSTRLITQIYKDFFLGREIMVIAVESFPAEAVQAMFNFYPNRVYKLNVPVTELVSLDEESRNEVLKRRKDAFIFVPNCEMKKLTYLVSTWHRSVGVYGQIANVCLVKVSK